ncbi:hypothetical protein SGLAM104S_07455 [Streptomyces glaucescens]
MPELRFLGERPQRGKVVLSGARIVYVVHRGEQRPGPGHLHMPGFTYENLVPQGPFRRRCGSAGVAAATAEYNPDPYERLAAVLRALLGEDEDAREVLLAKQRRRCETLPPAAKIVGYAQDWTVAYGYLPGRPPCGWRCCGRRAPSPSRTPGRWTRAAAGSAAPPWNPARSPFNLPLPVIDLGQLVRLATARRLAVAGGGAGAAGLGAGHHGGGGRDPAAAPELRSTGVAVGPGRPGPPAVWAGGRPGARDH